MTSSSTSRSHGTLNVNMDVNKIIDPAAARRLAQLLFAPSTGAVVAASTGVAS